MCSYHFASPFDVVCVDDCPVEAFTQNMRAEQPKKNATDFLTKSRTPPPSLCCLAGDDISRCCTDHVAVTSVANEINVFSL